jgi:ABC-2 type transport system permease protein
MTAHPKTAQTMTAHSSWPALLAAEVLKLRTLRMTWVAAVLAVAVSALIGFAGVRISLDAGEEAPLTSLAAAPVQALWFLAIVVAVLASAGEFHHKTVRTTLLAEPRRGRVLAAKGTAAAAYGALLVLLGTASAVLAGLVTAAAEGTTLTSGGSWGHVAAGVGVGAVFAVFATGLGVLTRSTAAAITAVLLWRFVGEGVLPAVLRADDVTRWTPNGAASGLVGLGADSLAPWAAGLVLAGYAAAIGGIAAVLFLRRDPA